MRYEKAEQGQVRCEAKGMRACDMRTISQRHLDGRLLLLVLFFFHLNHAPLQDKPE